MKLSNVLDAANNRLTAVADPTAAQDAATKAYVDALLQGFKWKEPVRAASTANLTLSGTQTVDGVALVSGDRVLVKNQSTGSANGIYVVAAGSWTRATDFDANAEILAATTFVSEGTTQGNTTWNMTTDGPITLGTTALVFTQTGGGGTSYTAGTGITITGGVIAIDTAVVARKVSATVGNGTLTQITVNHNLGTEDVIVAVRLAAGSKAAELVDWQVVDANNIQLTWAVAPTTGQYRVTVQG